jgi:hypothetical protein
MDLQELGKWIFFAGIGIAFIGLIVWFLPRFGIPLGNLKGDIRIEKEGFSFYFPVVTCIVISIALTLLINFVSRFFR